MASAYGSSKKAGRDYRINFEINQVDLLAHTTKELIAPVDGYITNLHLTVQIAVTTGGTVTVATGDALGTAVGGIALVIANSATKGTRVLSKSTSADIATTKVVAGDRIGILVPSFATAGALTGHLTINSANPNS